MNTLHIERLPQMEQQIIRSATRRLGLADRIAMRTGLWMLLWSMRFHRIEEEHSPEDERLENQEHLDREARERGYASMTGMRPF
ncbi:hypothetical protein GCM10025789_09050 [Tessaracoccus lubricantis]|uniref:Uncharacterized protein n=1 Tax=Tessaracoccus lubricantis TaxID=545543 RepID=A0ABP9FDY6_9ACTN